MTQRRSVVLTVMGLALLIVHLHYPLDYVGRVLIYRDADFSDIHTFPSRRIAPSQTPSLLPRSLDGRIARVLAEHSEVESLETLLATTETSSFLVIHRGVLVEERYLLGHDEDRLQNSFSVTKSVLATLVGLAVSDGLLDLDDPITRYLPELGSRDPRFSKITLEHLLNMRSGIQFSSEVSFPFVNADNALIYYHSDLESVALERPTVESPPGTFLYNNYNPTLVGLILRRTTGLSVAEYLQRQVWQPMGAEASAGWTVDDQNFERMESGFHARARDLARFGLLYLNEGLSTGRRVLPESWVRATDWAEPEVLEEYDGRSWDYHLGWWIIPRPEPPSDLCAIGRFGQFIYVSPQYQTVFVRTGPSRGHWGDRDWTELFYFAAERLASRATPKGEVNPDGFASPK